ncbi:hypothetical protein AB205_0197390, partial [Aquarana catesbeiana]
MMDNQPPLTSPDGSSNGNPPERCPHPWDSTQEDHTIPHHQGEELKYIKVELKEEEEEMLVSGDQQSMEEGCPLYSWDFIKEDPNTSHHQQIEELKDIKVEVKDEEEETVSGDQQSVEEGCPLYFQDSTQEDHIYTENDQGEERKDIKVEDIKEEEEERLVSGDQQSMEEGEMIMESKQEESFSLHMYTNGGRAWNISEGHPILSSDYDIEPYLPGDNLLTQNIQRSMESSDRSHICAGNLSLVKKGLMYTRKLTPVSVLIHVRIAGNLSSKKENFFYIRKLTR